MWVCTLLSLPENCKNPTKMRPSTWRVFRFLQFSRGGRRVNARVTRTNSDGPKFTLISLENFSGYSSTGISLVFKVLHDGALVGGTIGEEFANNANQRCVVG